MDQYIIYIKTLLVSLDISRWIHIVKVSVASAVQGVAVIKSWRGVFSSNLTEQRCTHMAKCEKRNLVKGRTCRHSSTFTTFLLTSFHRERVLQLRHLWVLGWLDRERVWDLGGSRVLTRREDAVFRGREAWLPGATRTTPPAATIHCQDIKNHVWK